MSGDQIVIAFGLCILSIDDLRQEGVEVRKYVMILAGMTVLVGAFRGTALFSNPAGSIARVLEGIPTSLSASIPSDILAGALAVVTGLLSGERIGLADALLFAWFCVVDGWSFAGRLFATGMGLFLLERLAGAIMGGSERKEPFLPCILAGYLFLRLV